MSGLPLKGCVLNPPQAGQDPVVGTTCGCPNLTSHSQQPPLHLDTGSLIDLLLDITIPLTNLVTMSKLHSHSEPQILHCLLGDNSTSTVGLL